MMHPTVDGRSNLIDEGFIIQIDGTFLWTWMSLDQLEDICLTTEWPQQSTRPLPVRILDWHFQAPSLFQKLLESLRNNMFEAQRALNHFKSIFPAPLISSNSCGPGNNATNTNRVSSEDFFLWNWGATSHRRASYDKSALHGDRRQVPRRSSSTWRRFPWKTKTRWIVAPWFAWYLLQTYLFNKPFWLGSQGVVLVFWPTSAFYMHKSYIVTSLERSIKK